MNNKKSLIALALVALVGLVGGTFAYFTSSAKLTNEFVTGTYSTSVTEEFVSPSNWTPGTTTNKKVNVTNNGSVEVAVRATYTEKWLAADGTTVLSGTRNGEQVAQFTVGSDWELATDGYYYYKDTLGTNETSTNFISSVTFNKDFELLEGTDIECTTSTVDGKTTNSCTSLTTGYAGATYSLEITIETIQADKKWDYTVGSSTSTAYNVGDEITVAGETFNVIKDNGDTVTMLAAYNLGTDYRQSTTDNRVTFSNSSGWELGDDIDIQSYDGPAKTYVNAYVSYLQGETGDSGLTGTLITLSQLESLGCDISGSYTCANSTYASWLVNGQYWWTRSADTDSSNFVSFVNDIGYLLYSIYDNEIGFGVRPVITISKSVL